MSYSLDAQQARAGDQRGGYISEIGAYTGKFTRAEEVVATSGTKGVSFTFQADDGQKCDVSLYTVKSDGTQLLGYSVIMALMACLNLRDIKPQNGRVKKYDRDAQREEVVEAVLFPELMNKPIGVFLETEEFEKKDGSVGTSMKIAGFYQAGTHFTATEILDRATKAERFEKMLAGLRHRPLRRPRSTGTAPYASSGHPARQAASGGSGVADMDDDIPF